MSTINVVNEVIKVRDSVSLIDMLSSFGNSIRLNLRRFSRIRSDTTTVSLTE